MKKLMIVALACAVSSGVMAAGFQASLTPNIAIHDRDTTIEGVSIGVWNENPGTQWQLGFVNGATGDSAGFQCFVFLPTFFNYAENYTGVQLAFVNYASGNVVGWQLGGIASITTDMVGLQSSAILNYAGTMHGVQLGLVNYAETVNEWAFQLGLVNIIADNPWFSNFPGELAQGMVIVNWSFGGSN